MTRTGQLVVLSGSKATAMYVQRKKPMLLRWTQAWRRNHKKLNVETGQKRKARKIVRTVARNFVGMTSDEVRSAPRAGAAAVERQAAATYRGPRRQRPRRNRGTPAPASMRGQLEKQSRRPR